MIILHCIKEEEWKSYKDKKFYGESYLDECGFIHCSDIDTFKNVAPEFKDEKEPMVLLCIDTSKVQAEIKWEDLYNLGEEYPHIYGMLNLDSVIDVVPFIRNEDGKFVLNEELKQYLG